VFSIETVISEEQHALPKAALKKSFVKQSASQ
jgi:hypothetical protein